MEGCVESLDGVSSPIPFARGTVESSQVIRSWDKDSSTGEYRYSSDADIEISTPDWPVHRHVEVNRDKSTGYGDIRYSIRDHRGIRGVLLSTIIATDASEQVHSGGVRCWRSGVSLTGASGVTTGGRPRPCWIVTGAFDRGIAPKFASNLTDTASHSDGGGSTDGEVPRGQALRLHRFDRTSRNGPCGRRRV